MCHVSYVRDNVPYERQPPISSMYVYAGSLSGCPAAYAAVWFDVLWLAGYQRRLFVYTTGGLEAAIDLSVEALLFGGVVYEIP